MTSPLVLIVDDDHVYLEVLRELLESLGARVRTAEDAVSSFKAALEEKPSLIITDVNMPGFGSGLDAVRCIRQQQGFASVPIIIVTGLPPAQMKGWDLQGVTVLTKPPMRKDLQEAVRRALGGTQP